MSFVHLIQGGATLMNDLESDDNVFSLWMTSYLHKLNMMSSDSKLYMGVAALRSFICSVLETCARAWSDACS